MKSKPYSEITVEIGTQLKTVKITSNIFAVYFGTVSPLFMGKCSWIFFLQKMLVLKSKTYNSQILPK